jgi:hypothetical protein
MYSALAETFIIFGVGIFIARAAKRISWRPPISRPGWLAIEGDCWSILALENVNSLGGLLSL